MRRRWVVAGLAAVLATGAAGWVLARGDGETRWVPVEFGELVVTVEVEGTLASRDSSMLTPPQIPNFYDFKIAYLAPEGRQVEQGAPVLGFDTSELERQLLTQQTQAEQAGKNIDKLDTDIRQQVMGLELELAEAQAALRRADLRNEIPDDLRAANEARIAELDVRAARTRVQSLELQIAAAEESGVARRAALVAQRDRAVGRVREIERSIEQMTVGAPRAGTVIYASNWRGEKKKVGDSAWRRERIIELPDLERMLARGEVDEADAGRIAVGQRVTFRLDAHPDEVYAGTVESIWRTVQRKSGTRNPLKVVRLDIALDEADQGRMRPGMRFQGRIEVERLENVLTIPTRSVAPTPEGPVVYRGGVLGPEPVAVELGVRADSRFQVISGLDVGEHIAEVPPASGDPR